MGFQTKALYADNTAPAVSALTVTPSDSTLFTLGATRGIYVGGTGDVSALMADGTTGVFKSVPAGTLLPICAQRINTTNTSASNMVALW